MIKRKRTYADIKAQIEALQQEAEALRAQEIAVVIAEVRTKMAEYGITERDIVGRKRVKPAAGTSKAKRSALPR